MTIDAYVRACVRKMEGQGMRMTTFARTVLLSSSTRLAEMMCGTRTPTLDVLKRIEACAGISLDRIDPRIHRGEAQFGQLAKMIDQRLCSVSGTARLLEVQHDTFKKELDTGTLAPRAHVSQVIRICDLVEGRLQIPLRKDATQRTREVQEKKTQDELLKLPPEAQGDSEYLRARRAFGHCVPGNPRNFGLRKSGEGLYTAVGAAYRWRLEIQKNGVRVVALNKKTGGVLLDRLVPS